MSDIEVAYEVDNKQSDLIAEGFHKLAPELVKDDAPTIKWGRRYLDWSQQRKIEYLEKFCSSMNHAAFLIQNERNELMEICKKQEKHVESLKKQLDSNNAMIQTQIANMNADRQKGNETFKKLKAEIRRLKDGTIH